ILVAALALLSVCSPASAQTFSEDFESYVAGSAIHGQGGWKGWGNVASAGATVSSKYAYSGKNSVEILGTSDLVHEFDIEGGLWIMTAMQYIPSGTSGEPFFIIMNKYDDAGTARDWSAEYHYRLGSGTITSEKEGDGKVAQIIFDRWIEIKLIIDLDNNTYDWYYNGVLIETHAWDVGGNRTIQAIDLYGDSASSTYIDDILLTAYDLTRASKPSPENELTDVLRSTSLGWTAGKGMDMHNMYLGTSFDDVNNATVDNPLGVLVSEGQTATTFAPAEPLEFGATYYWRVDEVNDAATTKGEVWSFTVEPYVYPITGITATASSAQPDMDPQDIVNGVGLNDADQHSVEGAQMWMTTGTAKPDWVQFDFGQSYKLYEMWVWNSNQMIEGLLGFGAKDVTVEYSADGQTWTTLEGAPQFAQATGVATYTHNTTVSFGGIMAQYVKLTINSNWGGIAPQTGLAEVRFYYVPLRAYSPSPADAGAGVNVNTTLQWRPGREAASHMVYVGADSAAVASGSIAGQTVTDCSLTLDALDFVTTYYWRVDEVGDAGTYAGNVWSFTTAEYLAIDDFEAYNDNDNRIYDTWIDGLTSKASGSQVGYSTSPFAEKTVVNSGKQSMPMSYDNSSSPYYSEAARTWSTPQNWTAGGADTLKLSFRGNASTVNTSAPLYVAVKDSAGTLKVVANSNADAVLATSWQTWTVPFSTFTDAGVKMNKVTALYIGVGNRTSPTAGGTGTIYIDDVAIGNPTE
ncbi:MAG: discoidin domain-containing protein, partial [Solirubrobacterales bacterium]